MHPPCGRDSRHDYAAGIRQGAPAAVQVADRFPLFQNVAETLEQVFTAHTQDLEAINAAQRRAPVPREDGTVTVPVPPPRASTAQDHAVQRRTQRLATYEQVWALHRQGSAGKAIARQLGIGKSTVFRYLRPTAFPERKQRHHRGWYSVLAPYKDLLLTRWNAGCREARRLFHDRTQQGYAGSYATVARYTRRLR